MVGTCLQRESSLYLLIKWVNTELIQPPHYQPCLLGLHNKHAGVLPEKAFLTSEFHLTFETG